MVKADVGAAPLAETLLDLAVEHDAVDSVAEELEVVQRTLDYHLKLKDALRNSQIPTQARGDLVAEVLSGSAGPVTLSFLRLLIEVGKISMLGEIRREYADLSAEVKKRTVADVTTAVPLDSALEAKIKSELARRAGKEVKIRHHVDPSLLGGFIIRYEGEVLDASLSHQLSSLRTTMGGLRK